MPSDDDDHRRGGWVDVADDVWGTTLDVYTHVGWRHLFACLRRRTGGGEGAEEGPTEASSSAVATARVRSDEITGTCGRCAFNRAKAA